MKQVIVIINPTTPVDLPDMMKASTNGQPIPEGVLKISETTFLIDIHKSLPFFSGLVYNAHVRNVPCFVFAVEDTLLLPNWGQDNQEKCKGLEQK